MWAQSSHELRAYMLNLPNIKNVRSDGASLNPIHLCFSRKTFNNQCGIVESLTERNLRFGSRNELASQL